jgi:hypothetical protein
MCLDYLGAARLRLGSCCWCMPTGRRFLPLHESLAVHPAMGSCIPGSCRNLLRPLRRRSVAMPRWQQCHIRGQPREQLACRCRRQWRCRSGRGMPVLPCTSNPASLLPHGLPNPAPSLSRCLGCWAVQLRVVSHGRPAAYCSCWPGHGWGRCRGAADGGTASQLRVCVCEGQRVAEALHGPGELPPLELEVQCLRPVPAISAS